VDCFPSGNTATLSGVNLILFEPAETRAPLPRADRRAIHLLEVLRRQPGETFDAGLVNGPVGKGTVMEITGETVQLNFVWKTEPPTLAPITLLTGLPRPQTARKILQEATSLGVSELHFVRTERGEPNYAGSTLWVSGEWRRHVIAGAEQAFCTRLPEVSYGRTLAEALPAIGPDAIRVVLDNYESPSRLADIAFSGGPVILAIGAERGWSPAEREMLRQQNFIFAHLGRRVLRVETACVAALAVVQALSGFA
jgi:16S rRNA (uracil1498-N3)-methyltransferase